VARVEITFYASKQKEKVLSFSLQWCELNFCTAITSLTVKLCNRSHHL
jgi:hypothetical protein